MLSESGCGSSDGLDNRLGRRILLCFLLVVAVGLEGRSTTVPLCREEGTRPTSDFALACSDERLESELAVAATAGGSLTFSDHAVRNLDPMASICADARFEFGDDVVLS